MSAAGSCSQWSDVPNSLRRLAERGSLRRADWASARLQEAAVLGGMELDELGSQERRHR